jgi:hypothetical protein
MNTKKIANASIAQLEADMKQLESDLKLLEDLQVNCQRTFRKLVNSSTPEAYLIRTVKLCGLRERFDNLSMCIETNQAGLLEQVETLRIMACAAQVFDQMLIAAYPEILFNRVARQLLQEFAFQPFESYTHFKLQVAEILCRLWFSSGEYKAYDKKDAFFFDPSALIAAHNGGRLVNNQWLDQFIYCLAVNQQEENINLMEITPETQRLQCESLFITLYLNTEKTHSNGQDTFN